MIGDKIGEVEAALRSGEHWRAVRLARSALSVSPGNGAGFQLLGIALVSLELGELALAMFRRAVWAEVDGAAFLNLAALQLSKGRIAEAGRTVRRGLALSPQAVQGWNLRRQLDTNDDGVGLGRVCALVPNLGHELQHAALRIAAGKAGAVSRRLRTLLHGRPELIDVARSLLKAIDTLCRTKAQRLIGVSDDFDHGLALVATGHLEEAAASFHADLAADPASIGSRAAYAATIHILTNDPPEGLDVPGIGRIGVEKIGDVTRLSPLDRRKRGVFLFGYNAGGVLLPETDERFSRHSNQWESRVIARMLLEHGFAVDLTGLFDAWANPETYDGVFCLHSALSRHARRLRVDCRKIMLLTGSSPDFQNEQEARRLRELKQRTGVTAPAVRSLGDVAGEIASLRLADECWLFGNNVTRATYEAAMQDKIRLVSPSGAPLRQPDASRTTVDPRRWLWFSGHGAALKGLDRVVEVFLRRPDWRLDVVGPAADEAWFRTTYGDRISGSGTIRVLGSMSPVSFDFAWLTAACIGFVAPSASEGQSTSAITCMQAGLFPILSRQCGIDLPPGCGTILETCSLEEIEAAIEGAHRLPEGERHRQIEATTREARRRFSREAFRTAIATRLREATASIGR